MNKVIVWQQLGFEPEPINQIGETAHQRNRFKAIPEVSALGEKIDY
jgi:hypothetical protein